MDLSLSSLSKVDDRTKHAVSGWLRIQVPSMDLYDIPLISSLCILFFGGYELFEIAGSDVQISDDGKTINKKGTDSNNNRSSSYGMTRIWSKSKSIYQWDLKVKAYDIGFYIGLSSTVHPDKCYWKQAGHHYAWWILGSLKIPSGWESYGEPAKVNDIVSIVLDLKQREIRFLVNHQDQGVAYQGDDIKIGDDIEYRLAVIPCSRGDSIEIVDFFSKN